MQAITRAHTHSVTVNPFPCLALSAKHRWASGCISVFAYPAYPAYKRTPEKKHTAWICMARSGWDDLLPLCCYWPAKPKVNELPETELHKQPSTAVIPGRDGNSQWQRTGNATPLRGITGESWRTTGSWKPGAPSMLREVMEKSLSPSSWSVLGFWAFWSLKSPYWLTKITKQQLIIQVQMGVCHLA